MRSKDRDKSRKSVEVVLNGSKKDEITKLDSDSLSDGVVIDDDDADSIEIIPIEEEMNLEDLMRQKVSFFHSFFRLGMSVLLILSFPSYAEEISISSPRFQALLQARLGAYMSESDSEANDDVKVINLIDDEPVVKAPKIKKMSRSVYECPLVFDILVFSLYQFFWTENAIGTISLTYTDLNNRFSLFLGLFSYLLLIF